MKRFALSLLVLVVIISSITSCEKCTVCTAQPIEGEVVTEYCGNELDVRTFEQFFIDSLNGLPDTIPGYCERGPYDM